MLYNIHRHEEPGGKEKKSCTVPSQGAETFAATYATSCLSLAHCVTFVCLQEQVETAVASFLPYNP